MEESTVKLSLSGEIYSTMLALVSLEPHWNQDDWDRDDESRPIYVIQDRALQQLLFLLGRLEMLAQWYERRLCVVEGR